MQILENFVNHFQSWVMYTSMMLLVQLTELTGKLNFVQSSYMSLETEDIHYYIQTLVKYSSLPSSRTRLSRISRYREHTSVSFGFDSYLSVVYYRVSRTRLSRISRYREHTSVSFGFDSYLSVIYYLIIHHNNICQ